MIESEDLARTNSYISHKDIQASELEPSSVLHL